MEFIQNISEKYFDNSLSDIVIELMEPINGERTEVQEWVRRMAEYKQKTGISGKNFSETEAWVIATLIPKLLPGAWNNTVPPITLKGRHIKIDDYLENNNWKQLGAGQVMLDLGCGFPPETTIDSANTFTDVNITGADPSFGRYLVKDQLNNYAAFDAESELLYFQPETSDMELWEKLFSDLDNTKARFLEYLERAKLNFSGSDNEYKKWMEDGIEVQQNPILRFEKSNLNFLQQGIGSDFSNTFDVIRCFNVLIYFDEEFRKNAVKWAGTQLNDNGIFIVGFDWENTRAARYSVYQSQAGEMIHKEFAISVDNIRPIEVPSWFSINDEEYDLLAKVEVVSVIRNDKSFINSFDNRMDELLKDQSLCARKKDGYLGEIPTDASPEFMDSASNYVNAKLEEEGYTDGAIEVLKKNGIEAWINCVGHIAVNPKDIEKVGKK